MLKRACNEDQIAIRKKEIVGVVNKMFDRMDYQDISMKTISEHISIARSSLYCYYNTKEEIMLDILQDEYLTWLNDLIVCFNNQYESSEKLAIEISNIYFKHLRLLKIVSIYLTEIEMHCNIDKLIKFKAHFVDVLPKLVGSIESQFPNSSHQDVINLFNALMMLAHSLYPMIKPSSNQYKAMKKVGMDTNDDGFNYCRNYILFLLKNM